MRLAAALLLIPAAAEAGLAGTYAVDCADPPFESRLRIEGDTVRFYESTCRMTNPVPVRDMAGAVLYDLACTGEGESWTERTLFMPGSDGGLVRVIGGMAFTYARCD